MTAPPTPLDADLIDEAPVSTKRAGRSTVVLVALLVLLIGPWILATPRSAGPDEPGHNVRAAGLVRGDVDGVEFNVAVNRRGFDVPRHVGFPDPVCFAFQPEQPASCAAGLEFPLGSEVLGTRSSDYPVWGFFLPGLGSYAPAALTGFVSRFLDALIPIGLLALSLVVARRRGPMAVGGVLLSITPMAMFTFAVVNPSGLAVAGGIGLWTGLQARLGGEAAPRAAAWLTALSWAALVLPRRDGLIWAGLILSVLVVCGGLRLRAVWSDAGLASRAVAVAATLATLAWAATSALSSSRSLFLVPPMVVAAVLVRRFWERASALGRAAQGAALATGAVVSVMVSAAVMSRRAAGFDSAALRIMIDRTGADLTAAVGNLGWLDTPIPTSMLLLWILGLGLITGVAVVEGAVPRLAIAGATVAVAVGTSWSLAVAQSDRFGPNWQGRYYLPLLVGLPIVAGFLPVAATVGRRVGLSVAALSLVVLNVSLAAMMRRFGVGVSGSVRPSQWDTYDAPLPLVVLLLAHGAASIGLLLWVYRSEAVEPSPAANVSEVSVAAT